MVPLQVSEVEGSSASLRLVFDGTDFTRGSLGLLKVVGLSARLCLQVLGELSSGLWGSSRAGVAFREALLALGE